MNDLPPLDFAKQHHRYTYARDSSETLYCHSCGALVADVHTHTRWHDALNNVLTMLVEDVG